MEESPGSTEIRCRLTSGGGDPRESATENEPPVFAFGLPRARVKRCGKSAPRRQQWGRQGKPHREQDRIGVARFRSRSQAFPARPPGLVARSIWQQMLQMNGHCLGGQTPRYRTRLTGQLATHFMAAKLCCDDSWWKPFVNIGLRIVWDQLTFCSS